ncbi:MAG: 23S rRNA (pseudouridine(1915)-N(3))-methyltransferase RlmH [Simkaniaceae bacterium]|nr:23S rRNA (pseudouridine(1915)-N(3))-methyltransferase RlmH [Simkaniaceae bacterium]
MIKIKIITIGKIKQTWLQEGIQEYELRLKPQTSIEWHICRSDDQLIAACMTEKEIFSLDPHGKQLDSTELSHFIDRYCQQNGPRLTFVIGGSDGIPLMIKNRSKQLISFSKLTFTHQMMRLILLEQLYRSQEIQNRSPYHK